MRVASKSKREALLPFFRAVSLEGVAPGPPTSQHRERC